MNVPCAAPAHQLHLPLVLMFDSLRNLLSGAFRKRKKRVARSPRSAAVAETRAADDEKVEAEGSAPRVGLDNLDDERTREQTLRAPEEDILARVKRRVDTGNFELPQLPATSMAAMSLSSKPGVEISQLVSLISTDPILSSELLKVANSVLYATHEPADTLHQAVMRIGLRTVRSMMFSISMRGVILRVKSLSRYAEEVWRQAYSVACIARDIGPRLGFDPDVAFLIGQLHDIGKVALLSMLSREAQGLSDLSPAVVGRVFYDFHELAGAKMAEKWNLTPELASVAGCHHEFTSNEEFPRSAALAELAHKLDLFLSIARADEYRALIDCEAFEFLGVAVPLRRQILEIARRSYETVRGGAAEAA